MPFLKDKLTQLTQFTHKLAERYRLSGQAIFVDIELNFRLLGHITYSQSGLKEQHLQQLITETELLHLSEDKKQQAMQCYLDGQQLIADDFEASLRYFQGDELAKEMLLQSCWRMIWADRHLGVREYQLVHLWGYWLGWARHDIEKLGIAYRPVFLTQEHQQALALLEVTIDSSPELIKKMYKRQLSLHHPDKVMGAGGSIDDICAATEKTAKIHEAYTLLRMLHSF